MNSVGGESGRRTRQIDVINFEAGYPTAAEAKRRLVTELDHARRSSTRVLKLIHGYGSTGKGGKLRRALRSELTRMHAEGTVGRIVIGEAWSIFDDTTRQLLDRYPDLRDDRDLEQLNAGITIVEVR